MDFILKLKVLIMNNAETYTKNMAILEKSGLNYSGNTHGIRINTDQGNVMFYPTSNKYVYKNKSHSGNATDLIEFIKRIT